MASEREDFNLSGPLHLCAPDWKNPHHRKSVAACLIQGVYVLERDRQRKHQGLESLASPWWEFFHFELQELLVDDVDLSIFGAVYQFKCPYESGHSKDGSPQYVIAFRGTVNKPDSFSRDLKLDLQFIQNGLHQTSRFETGMQAVRKTVAAYGHRDVWLTGHSLGSAMAMLAGKNMAKAGLFLEAFLFNPPFLSAPVEKIKDKKLKHGIRVASSFITAGLAVAIKGSSQQKSKSEDFAALSAWLPCLFVNPADPLCSEYVGYFEHRKKMEELGVGNIERLATQNSIGDLFMSAFGKGSDALHLIPSANVTVNLTRMPDFKSAHGIHQWWSPDLHLRSKLYEYR